MRGYLGVWTVVLALCAVTAAAEEGGVKRLDPAALAACAAAGGHPASGIGPAEVCVLPTQDAGKACTTNADCESFCMAPEGVCGGWKPLFGCHEVFAEEGRSVTICLD